VNDHILSSLMEVSCSSELSTFSSMLVVYPGSPSWGMWNQPEMARRGWSEVYTSSTSWNDFPGCTATINWVLGCVGYGKGTKHAHLIPLRWDSQTRFVLWNAIDCLIQPQSATPILLPSSIHILFNEIQYETHTSRSNNVVVSQ